jgi:septal ring factor EnvC (AmiA/AmiB activator)
MNIDMKIIEIIFGCGLAVISYFLKAIHKDMNDMSKKMNEFSTTLAVGRKTFEDIERRFNELKDDRERRLLALEKAVFRKEG